MAELINCDAVEGTSKGEETLTKAISNTAQQDQRKVVQERTGKARLKQTAAHYYPQYTDYHREQTSYPAHRGRYKCHHYVSRDEWRWTMDQQQWTNGTDTYRDGDYQYYYHTSNGTDTYRDNDYRYYYHTRGNKNSRKTGSADDSRPDTSRMKHNKRTSDQLSSEDKRSLGRQKEVVHHVDKQQEDTGLTEPTNEGQKIESTKSIVNKDTTVNSSGKYRAKKSGHKSVPSAKETTSSMLSQPHFTTTVHSHKRKHKEKRTENNEVVAKSKESKDSGKGDIGKDSSVNVPGKYHVKRDTLKPATSSANVDNGKQIDIVSDSTSSHGQKRRDYKPKNFRPVKQHGGVASSIQSDVLSQQLFSGQYECMVCCDRVRVKDPVWSCSTCYHIFHLKCIKKWAKIPTDLENGKYSVYLFLYYVNLYTMGYVLALGKIKF